MLDLATIATWENEGGAKLDAYFLAAAASGFAGYPQFSSSSIPLAVALVVAADETEGGMPEALLSVFDKDRQSRITSSIFEPVEYEARSGYVCADVSEASLPVLAALPCVKEIQFCSPLLPHRPGHRTAFADKPPHQTGPQPPFTHAEKVVAVIDHGCPFAHLAFRVGDACRVVGIWDQDPSPDFPEGSVPTGLGYGRQVGPDEIRSFLNRAKGIDGHIDEDRCYRLAGYGALASRVTHGSATLGLLASRWLSPSLRRDREATGTRVDLADAAASAPILFVQLPRTIPLAPSRGAVEKCVLDGLRFILQSVGRETRDVTVVVGYGSDMGPHDGSSLFERALDAWVVAARKKNIELRVVFPSGNSFDQDRAAVIFPEREDEPTTERAGKTAGFAWWIPMGNEVPAFCEIWASDEPGSFTLTLTPPGCAEGAPTLTVASGWQAPLRWPAEDNAQCVVAVKRMDAQRMILLQVAPTERGASHDKVARSGRWRIDFKAGAGGSDPIHAYTCWGGRNLGFSQRTRATRFFADDDQVESGLVKILGRGTVLGSGCGYESFVIGGYENWGGKVRAPYSGAGESRGGKRGLASGGTDRVAVTEESPSLRGLLCIGTRSGIAARVNGTSVAAPQAARQLVHQGVLAAAPLPPVGRGPRAGPRPPSVQPRREEFNEKKLGFDPSDPGPRHDPSPHLADKQDPKLL